VISCGVAGWEFSWASARPNSTSFSRPPPDVWSCFDAHFLFFMPRWTPWPWRPQGLWQAPSYALEGLFGEVWLCNAQHVKNAPGRERDLSDVKWLSDVAAHKMVRPSFVPSPEVGEFCAWAGLGPVYAGS
jgi:hypothetical protein